MVLFQEFIDKVSAALTDEKQLDALKHNRMSPVTRRLHQHRSHPPAGNKKPLQSAVLLHLYPVDNKPMITLIKRAPDNTVHSGQVSFPGGKTEKTDKDLEHTALREAHEEVGISASEVKIIGKLSKLYIPPSNFDVHPYVGYTDVRPEFNTNNEVDKLLEVSIEDLLDKSNQTYKRISHQSGSYFVVPCFYVNEEIIWGATSMILGEFIDMVDRIV